MTRFVMTWRLWWGRWSVQVIWLLFKQFKR